MQAIMYPQWDDSVPIYRQLRDRVVAMILEGVLKEGDPLPSVRSVAADFRLNPLTVLKRSEEHTSELQSRLHIVCRLLLEKKKNTYLIIINLNSSVDCAYSNALHKPLV